MSGDGEAVIGGLDRRSARMRVCIDGDIRDAVGALAHRQGVTVTEWVNGLVRDALRDELLREVRRQTRYAEWRERYRRWVDVGAPAGDAKDSDGEGAGHGDS